MMRTCEICKGELFPDIDGDSPHHIDSDYCITAFMVRIAELENQLERLSWQLPRLEGNNGGDYLEMESLGGNLIRLRVGHCCVATDTNIVPVELLTAVLFPVMAGNWHKALDAIHWPKDFTEQLKAQAADESRRQSDIEAADSANYKTGIGYT